MPLQTTDLETHIIRWNWHILGLLLIICWLMIGFFVTVDEVQARYVIQDRIAFQITIAGASG
jgi:hypothetical protein